MPELQVKRRMPQGQPTTNATSYLSPESFHFAHDLFQPEHDIW
jgi:hypothetical protein